MMMFAEIEALPSPTARVAAYQEYVEQAPHHPLAWFNLAVEAEAARAYDVVRSAAETLRHRDAALFEMLPDRVRQLFQGERAAPTPKREIDGYRIIGVASATESRILYDAVCVTDDAPATLWRILDLSHASARTTFQLATDAPRVSGVAQPLGVVEDPEHGPLLAFERIRGESLRGDPRALLDIEVTLRLVRSAAKAALALQQAGALHGDLRPEAVIRDQSRSEETLLVGGRRARVSAPTPRGRLAWSSPEEVAGEVPTSATDVYSLGLLLHHLLTGAPPRVARRARPDSHGLRLARARRVDSAAHFPRAILTPRARRSHCPNRSAVSTTRRPENDWQVANRSNARRRQLRTGVQRGERRYLGVARCDKSAASLHGA